MAKVDDYREVRGQLPSSYLAWQVFGAGLENVGKDGKPVRVERRKPGDNEVLCRVDALGLCLSDIKIINLGGKHPRLRGRDLSVEPTVLGHECSITVVEVGRQWKDTFKRGDRFIVQADIYYKGMGYAFGYLISGGLAQYCYLDERALAGDEGCYLLPVRPDTGYSQAALAEPWACVEMSYCLEERLSPGNGAILIVQPDSRRALARPGVSCREAYPHAKVLLPDAACDPARLGEDAFDDIIVAATTPELVTALAPRLRKKGVMYLLGAPAKVGPAAIDIGRIHYDDLRFLGGGDTVEAVTRANTRTDLLPQGASLFVGAGGPMGQMHVQRAIEVACGSRLVAVTDLDRGRLDHIENRFGDMAAAKGVELHTFAPSEFPSQQAMDEAVRALAPNGYNDVCLLAPVVGLVPGAMAFAADNALVNVFAGLAIGSVAQAPLEYLCRGIKVIGSSGSRIRDLRKILEMVEGNQLNTNLSVAAIGGLNAARDGLEAVKAARYPGKTVIYPQIPDLPLMALEQIPERLPALAACLGPGGAWTKQAEQALLEMFL